jgi:hypothetical protein
MKEKRGKVILVVVMGGLLAFFLVSAGVGFQLILREIDARLALTEVLAGLGVPVLGP